MSASFALNYNKNAQLIQATYLQVDNSFPALMNKVKAANLSGNARVGELSPGQSQSMKLMMAQLQQMLKQFLAQNPGSGAQQFMSALASGTLPLAAVGGLFSREQQELASIVPADINLGMGNMV